MIDALGENGERGILQFPAAAVNTNCLDTNPAGKYLPNGLYSGPKQWIRLEMGVKCCFHHYNLCIPYKIYLKVFNLGGHPLWEPCV